MLIKALTIAQGDRNHIIGMTKADHHRRLELAAIDAELDHRVGVILAFAVRADAGIFHFNTVDLALWLKFKNFIVDTQSLAVLGKQQRRCPNKPW